MKKKKKGVKSVKKEQAVLETYEFNSDKIPVTAKIYHSEESFVPIYDISIASISPTTEIILERIRKELVREVNLGIVTITSYNNQDLAKKKFEETIENLIKKYFPDVDAETSEFLTAYLIQKSLGLGIVEILDDDPNLEEIVINNADEPMWVYHKKHGWLITTIALKDENQIKHYASMLGRKVGRQISVLEPLMDANIEHGDRVNATLTPISTRGNTITLRKHSFKPWTITDFLKAKTVSLDAAAFLWHCIQYELSTLITGGTASGKTAMLNVITNFFPPNQRLISIEDTRELELPKFLHWVPLVTRRANTEGKGGVSMLDLVVNSLRMRPDRIIVGEIRRKEEAEILFEAIHTGHSVFGTLHAKNTEETVTRLTSPPIEIPKAMLPGISLIVVQYRNRRTGLRRTFQISEITKDGQGRVLMQYDVQKDQLVMVNKSIAIMETLELYTGQSKAAIQKEIDEKKTILKWMLKQDITDVNQVGRVVAEFYTKKADLMSRVRKNTAFG